ncbi:MAG TPA: hypothetical protein DEO83_04050 [Lachnospiraceae bacterium]|nr:hypothetical protein [Lachnospiraceae bacterium]
MPRYNKNNRSFAQAVKSILPEVDASTEIESVKQQQEMLNKQQEIKQEEQVNEDKKESSEKKSEKHSEEKTEKKIKEKETKTESNISKDKKNDDSSDSAENKIPADNKKLDSGIEEIVHISDEEKNKNQSGKKSGTANAEASDSGIKEQHMSELEKELRSSEEIISLGEDTTFITKGTVISGNIESDGDVEVRGRVDGNIRCSGKLIIGGRVTGDIDAGELYSEEANISGEMRVRGTVKIGVGSVTVGNIYAETAVVAGAVKGDMDVRDEAVLESTAIVVGNIKSKSVDISSGAIVDGFCKQEYASVDIDKYFNGQLESI